MFNFLKGKKTYAILAVTAIFGAIDALNAGGHTAVNIPDFVYTILGTLGIWTNSKRTSK